MENKCSDPHPSAHAVICSALCFLLFAISLLPALVFLLPALPSTLPSVGSAPILSTLPSFLLLSALLFLLWSSCSAQWGCLPFCIKTQISFPPPENSPPFFQKLHPAPTFNPHILRALSPFNLERCHI